MSFLVARMADIVENMVLSDFLTGNSPQPYRRQTRAAIWLLQRPFILNNPKDVD